MSRHMHACTPPPGRTASALRLQVALDELAELGQTMVVLAARHAPPSGGHQTHPGHRRSGGSVRCRASPWAGRTTPCMRGGARGAGSECAASPNGTTASLLAHLVVELVVREEDVDRVPLPPQPHLTVPLCSSGVVLARCDPERLQCVLETPEVLWGEEDVDVDVVRGAGLGVVSECERAAEGVIDPARLGVGGRSPRSFRVARGGSPWRRPPRVGERLAPTCGQPVGEQEEVAQRLPAFGGRGGEPASCGRARCRSPLRRRRRARPRGCA